MRIYFFVSFSALPEKEKKKTILEMLKCTNLNRVEIKDLAMHRVYKICINRRCRILNPPQLLKSKEVKITIQKI